MIIISNLNLFIPEKFKKIPYPLNQIKNFY